MQEKGLGVMSINGLLAVNFLRITCVMCLEPNQSGLRRASNLIGPTGEDTVNEADLSLSVSPNAFIASEISFLGNCVVNTSSGIRLLYFLI
jgi:hypothetical protein